MNAAFAASPPAILVQPVNQGALAGASATFSVAADGTPPLTYTWKLNGSNIPGATDATFVVSNMQPSNAGTYTVVVSNDYGFKKSSSAVLIALGATNTLDFEQLPAVPGYSFSDAAQYYREKGFILSPLNTEAGYFAYWQTGSPNYTGSIALFDNNYKDYACLARSDGGYFDLKSIDLGNLQGGGTQTVALIGYDGFRVVASYDALLDANMRTFQLPEFSHLTEVRWQQIGIGHQFDNIVVYAEPENGAPTRIGIGDAAQFNSTVPLFFNHLRVQTRYRIKKSFDLVNWQVVSTFTANTTSMSSRVFSDPVPCAFYTLQIVP